MWRRNMRVDRAIATLEGLCRQTGWEAHISRPPSHRHRASQTRQDTTPRGSLPLRRRSSPLVFQSVVISGQEPILITLEASRVEVDATQPVQSTTIFTKGQSSPLWDSVSSYVTQGTTYQKPSRVARAPQSRFSFFEQVTLGHDRNNKRATILFP